MEHEPPEREPMIRDDGTRLIADRSRDGRLLALLASWEPLDEVFPDVQQDLPQVPNVTL